MVVVYIVINQTLPKLTHTPELQIVAAPGHLIAQ